MKRSIIWTLGLGLVALGGGIILARRGAAVAAVEDNSPLFTSQPQGAGQLIQLQAKEPLRAVRWLPPIAGGWALCQVSTQSDRQLIGLFQEGRLARTFILPRPEGVSDGFYRQTEIRDVAWVNDTLLLLLKAEGGRREAAMVMALSGEGSLQWTRRVQADHLAAADSAVWAWGSESAQHLSLTLSKREKAGRTGEGSGASEVLAWPLEAASPTAFLPTASGFLINHPRGLSAWRSEAGWVHTTGPSPSPLGFQGQKGSLTRCGATLYWQPEPGSLFKVSSDAQVLEPEPLPIPDHVERDSALLRLLGSDSAGRLWFGLASPSLPVNATPSTADPLQNGASRASAQSLSAEERAALAAHLKAPMDRIYAWKPGDKNMRATTWSQIWPRLGAPSTVAPPVGDGGFRPEAQGFLLGADQERWWLSLKSLP